MDSEAVPPKSKIKLGISQAPVQSEGCNHETMKVMTYRLLLLIANGGGLLPSPATPTSRGNFSGGATAPINVSNDGR